MLFRSQDKIKSITHEIESFNEQSINAIEDHERGWLVVQVGIILTVGVIAITLRHFFGQINLELKKEIDENIMIVKSGSITPLIRSCAVMIMKQKRRNLN